MSDSELFPYVLGSIRIGNVELKNRVVQAAHGTGLVVAGRLTEDFVAYHAARARGGVGLLILEAAGVHPSYPLSINLSTDDVISDYRPLLEIVAPLGTKVFQQLWLGPGPNGTWVSGAPALRSADRVTLPLAGYAPDPVTADEIASYPAAFAVAARRCQAAGLDGVEIHAAHGYLLASFLSPVTNRRDDAYGGSATNRERLLAEVVAAVRAAVGAEYPVGVRLSANEHVLGGLRPPDVGDVIDRLTTAHELDFVNLTSGTYYEVENIFAGTVRPHRYEMADSSQITARVGVPCIVTGRFMTLAEADEVVRSGDAAMVSMVRALIADPRLVAKSMQGEATRVRPCIGCNQGCIGGVRGPLARIGCAVNPAVGRERYLDVDAVEHVKAPLRVLVIGGGPGGLEAARTAAIAGHAVTLCEAEAELGGQLRFVRRTARSEVAALIDHLSTEVERLGVEIRVACRVGIDEVRGIGADHIIVATGARPRLDGNQVWRPTLAIPGWDAIEVLTSWDVLSPSSPRADGRQIVLYDDIGHYEAIDVAEALLLDGADLTFATRFNTVGERFEGGRQNWEVGMRPHRRRLVGNPRFELVPQCFVARIEVGHVILADLDAPAREKAVAADAIVMVSPAIADSSLPTALRAEGARFSVIGDAAGPRNIEAVIYEGHRAARALAPSPY